MDITQASPSPQSALEIVGLSMIHNFHLNSRWATQKVQIGMKGDKCLSLYALYKGPRAAPITQVDMTEDVSFKPSLHFDQTVSSPEYASPVTFLCKSILHFHSIANDSKTTCIYNMVAHDGTLCNSASHRDKNSFQIFQHTSKV